MPRSHKPANPDFTATAFDNTRRPLESKKSKSNGHCHLSPTGGHWWIIESPHLSDSKQSDGVCRYCGQRKQYWNNYEDAVRESNKERRKSTKANGEVEQ